MSSDTSVLYGMRVRLRHDASRAYLKSVAKDYCHINGSMQQIVGADALVTNDTIWIVKGADSLGENYPRGLAIRHGDLIRLEHELTRKNLHSHSKPSPLTNQQEVTAYGIAGTGDGNDDWVIDLGELGEWQFGKPMRLDFRGTGMVLHSHSGHSHPILTAGLQEVTAYRRGDANDPWLCELVANAEQPVPKQSGELYSTWNKDVFISHSFQDKALARELVMLLKAALKLTDASIRCASVQGNKFPFGALIDEQIKQEVAESKVFIALLTPHSLKSFYVLFEIGARWGKGKSLGPLLARGTKAANIGGPISGIHSLSATDRDEMRQFIGDVAGQLGVSRVEANSYDDELDAVIGEAKKRVKKAK